MGYIWDTGTTGDELEKSWYVERTAHVASVRKSNMSLGTTVLAIYVSVVWSIVMIT